MEVHYFAIAILSLIIIGILIDRYHYICKLEKQIMEDGDDIEI
jgi:hypothetical protein